ncbi:MAG: AAA family ATPase [Clostridia bacterium]|nr:AAA family ATPase [Clostridia bacterium]
MVYLRKFKLPSESDEINEMRKEQRTCFGTRYPFKLFPAKQLEYIEFEPVTIFYGSNGSGKTTLINVIAEKLNVIRHSEFNNSAFFEPYTRLCRRTPGEIPSNSQILSSDDVFDYAINMRYLNSNVDYHREELFRGYGLINLNNANDPSGSYRQLHGLDDYDRYKEVTDARLKTQSSFVKERLAKNVDMFSNGETAMRYFVEHIDRDALYLLDEPENSLSIKLQLDLAKYIGDSARFYNCQFIMSTHSPILLSIEGAKIYDLDSVPVDTKSWTELENVREYFNFFKEHKEEFE